MHSDDFIIKLNSLLPSGFETKKFDGMPRIHIKFDHYGFAVIDLRKYSYNLFVLDGLFSSIGIHQFERIANMGNKRNRIMRIPYEDTSILEELIKYVIADPSVLEDKAVRSY